LSVLQVEFSTSVYENPEDKIADEIVVQPAKRLAFQYELAAAILIIPAVMFGVAIFWMKKSKNTPPRLPPSKSTPV